MDETRLLYYEFITAMDKCEKTGYCHSSVDMALKAAYDYYNALPSGEKKSAVGEIAQSLYKKAIEAKEAEEKFAAGREKRQIGIDELFPLMSNTELQSFKGYTFETDTLKDNMDIMYKDNALMCTGPVEEELLLRCKAYAAGQGTCRVVDLKSLDDDSLAHTLRALMAHLGHAHDETVIYSGLENFKGSKRGEVFASFLRLTRSYEGVRQFILSTDPPYYFNDEYFKLTTQGLKGDITNRPVAVCTPPYPTYKYVSDALEKFSPSDEDRKCIKRDCVFLGYSGLDKVLKSATADNWKDVVASIKEQRDKDISLFLQNHGEEDLYTILHTILDTEWDYKIKLPKRKSLSPIQQLKKEKYTLPSTTYDCDAYLDTKSIRQGVQAILDMEEDANGQKVSLFAKCGCAVRYAVYDFVQNVLNLPDEERAPALEMRFNIAYAALTQLLKIPYGSLLFNINDEDQCSGLCCDRGHTIRMEKTFLNPSSYPIPKKGTVLDKCNAALQWGCKTLMHECFHALQFKCMDIVDKGQTERCWEELEYYRINLGITEGRINEGWETYNKYGYTELLKDFGNYMKQVLEADARVFENDCWDMGLDIALPKF